LLFVEIQFLNLEENNLLQTSSEKSPKPVVRVLSVWNGKKSIRTDAFLLPQNATYNPVNWG
jgi:hypothetical protein